MSGSHLRFSNLFPVPSSLHWLPKKLDSQKGATSCSSEIHFHEISQAPPTANGPPSFKAKDEQGPAWMQTKLVGLWPGLGVGQGRGTLATQLHSSAATTSPAPAFEAAINIDSGKSMHFQGLGSMAKLQGSGQSHPCAQLLGGRWDWLCSWGMGEKYKRVGGLPRGHGELGLVGARKVDGQ